MAFAIFLITICFNIASSKNLKCKFCKNKINGRYITQEKNAYHEQCYQDHIQLKCDHCKNIINGIYNLKDEKSYHQQCFINFILDKCDVCYQPMMESILKILEIFTTITIDQKCLRVNPVTG